MGQHRELFPSSGTVSDIPGDQTENPKNWQLQMTDKLRVEHMMNFYQPIMTELEALECLQEGHFGIEDYGGVTDCSMVFNPTERTKVLTSNERLVSLVVFYIF